MAYKCISVEREGQIATVTLNRPEVLNALNQEMITELLDLLDRLPSDEESRVVILEGAGGNFCSGADMSLFLENRSAPQWLEGMKLFGRLIRGLRQIPQPVVVKLRGAAVGGGANLALTGDFVVASHNTRFRENFIHLGLILDGGGTYFLPRLVGLVKARELALLGDEIDGKTAASMGLIYKSVPDDALDGEVSTLAETLSKRSFAAMSMIKHGLESNLDKSLSEVLEWESSHQPIMLQRQEHKDLVQLFLAMKETLKDK
ncbi:MAG: enoyl-CoA hydratase/isomerase family protein [Desulfobacteraceae bacterium]|nr:enoyl-CoA hydratase/isomerase family protein [Desulfobacteraceae bacterium]